MYVAKKELFNAFCNLCKSIPTIACHLGNYLKPFSIHPPLTQLDECPLTSLRLRHYKISTYPTSQILFCSKDSCHPQWLLATMQSLPTFVLAKTFQTSTQKHLPQNPLLHVLHVLLKTKLKDIFFSPLKKLIQFYLKGCSFWEKIDTNHF